MINKIYNRILKEIKESYLFLCFSFVLVAVLLYEVPYYVTIGGGIINVDDRIEVENAYEAKGTFNMCYVKETEGTVMTYLLAKVIPNWELDKKETMQATTNETFEEINIRNKAYLNYANNAAIKVAYEKAGIELKTKNSFYQVLSLTDETNGQIKVGDIVLEIDGTKIDDFVKIDNYLDKFNDGDEVIIKVQRNGKVKEIKNSIFDSSGKKYIGVNFMNILEYDTDPKVEFSFARTESGPSGGLMTTLAIYNSLIKEDITNGLKISGTGTIDKDGAVGEIGGVKFKLGGAVKAKSDIFFVPKGENYNEAIKEKKKHNYKIKIYGVSTFEEALKYLRNAK